MDLSVLRNFISIVEAGNVTSASEKIHIAQPTLSKQLRQLECYYDAKLVLTERGSRQIILTDAGRLLYDKAKYMCSLDDAALEEIRSCERGASGTLRISVANSRSKLLIERVLNEYSKAYPDVDYMIFESSYVEQCQQLLNGIGEIGLLSSPPDKNSDFEELFHTDEYFAAVFNKESKWLKDPDRKGILLKQLEDIPVSVSSGYYEEFKQCCVRAGFVPLIKSINTTRNTALFWAVADMAVTIVPMSDGDNLEENLTAKKILDADVDIYKSVVKVKGRPLSLLALKFLEFYNEYGYAKRLCNIQALYEESKKNSKKNYNIIFNK